MERCQAFVQMLAMTGPTAHCFPYFWRPWARWQELLGSCRLVLNKPSWQNGSQSLGSFGQGSSHGDTWRPYLCSEGLRPVSDHLGFQRPLWKMLNPQEPGSSIRRQTSNPRMELWYPCLASDSESSSRPWVRGLNLSSPALITLGFGDTNYGFCAIRQSRDWDTGVFMVLNLGFAWFRS